ncbi:nucleotidyltransferase domain-containing protein [Exiguobacterium sp. TDN 0502]|uniref:nucleotidyltransferase domain-containing protein n=1 Tax=Exiguobacterium sp. TDN 0502 TaxID=3420731 RepID=UPI003D77B34A
MNLEEALAYIVKAFQQEQIRFGIGGSLLLAHHGLPVTPRDIDVVVTLEDAERAIRLLAEMGTVVEQDETSLYATQVFQEFIIKGIDVDLMSGLQIRHDEGIFVYPFAEQTM